MQIRPREQKKKNWKKGKGKKEKKSKNPISPSWDLGHSPRLPLRSKKTIAKTEVWEKNLLVFHWKVPTATTNKKIEKAPVPVKAKDTKNSSSASSSCWEAEKGGYGLGFFILRF